MQKCIFGMSSDDEVEDFVPTSSKGRQRGSHINVGNDLSTTSVSLKKSKQRQVHEKLSIPIFMLLLIM